MSMCLGAAAQTMVRYDRGDGLSSTHVGGGVQDRDGLLWFATWSGLCCYDGYEFRQVKIQPGDGSSIGTNLIRDIHLLSEGNILCHTDNDIYEFDLVSHTFRDLPAGRKDTLMAKVGRRWHGLTDAQGCLWTSDSRGLYKTYKPHHPAHILDGSRGEHPRTFFADRDGRLWVGRSTNPGVNIYAHDGTLLDSIELDAAPYCIYRSSNGDMWIGGKPGFLMKAAGKSLTTDAVYDIKEDSRGRLWVATFGEGVKCITNPAAEAPQLSPSLGGRKVRKLLITPAGTLVAATNDGLLVGDINKDDCSAVELRAIRRDGKRASSLCSNWTMSVVRDSLGNIYVATDSGVDVTSEESLLSDTPTFRHVSTRNSSLAGDECLALAVESDSLLMIVGDDKVMVYNTLTGNTVTLSETFWSDTCEFAEATPLRLADGSWLFGSVQGAFKATPHNIYSRGYIPPIVFTTLSVNGGTGEFCLPSKSLLRLDADERNVTIGFSALDYMDNSAILYRVSVDGSPWTDASTMRSVTLFNMSPGSHVIEVQSTDRYGRWVDNVKRLEVRVEPYWHETWWARVMFALLILTVAGGLVYTYLYIRRVNRQRSELLEKYMRLMREREERRVDEEESEGATALTPGANVSSIEPEQSPADAAFLDRVTRYIEDNLDNPDANIDDMAAASATSRSTLNRRLRSMLGVSASQFMAEARMRHACQLLERYSEQECPVADVAVKCGYSDVYYFQRVFRKRYDRSPAEYRNEQG